MEDWRCGQEEEVLDMKKTLLRIGNGMLKICQKLSETVAQGECEQEKGGYRRVLHQFTTILHLSPLMVG